jgi:hypothetical protein
MTRTIPRRPRAHADATLTERTVRNLPPAGAEAGPWAERANAAGAALVLIALVHAAAVSLYDLDVLRRNGGSGTVGQVTLSGFYSLTLIAGVVLLALPAQGLLLRTSARQGFLAVAAGAAAFVAVAQLISVYAALVQPSVVAPPPASQRFFLMLSPLGDLAMSVLAGWLAVGTVRGEERARGARDSATWTPMLRGALLLGVVAGILVQVGAAAGTGGRATLPTPSTQTPAATQVPLPGG